MLNRVIPTLLLSDSGFVKGKKFRSHRYVGDPINVIKIFNDKEVHEIVILDIDATRKGRLPNFDLLSQVATEAFFPLSYGGGINDLALADEIFKIGFEKVIVGTAYYENPELIRAIADKYGSQSIVFSLDVKKTLFGCGVYSNSGTQQRSRDPGTVAQNIEKLGGGEILLNAIGKEGQKSGYDLNLIRDISRVVGIPIVASCGAGNVTHFEEALNAGAKAVAAGTMFVFHGPHEAVLISYPSESEIKRLEQIGL